MRNIMTGGRRSERLDFEGRRDYQGFIIFGCAVMRERGRFIRVARRKTPRQHMQGKEDNSTPQNNRNALLNALPLRHKNAKILPNQQPKREQQKQHCKD